MELEQSALISAVILINILQVATVYIYYEKNRTYPGILWFLLGSILLAIGIASMLIWDGQDLEVVAILAPYIFVMIGNICFFFGISIFLGRDTHWRAITSVYCVFIATIVLFTFVSESSAARMIIGGMAIALISMGSFWLLQKHRPRSMRAPFNLLSVVFLAQGSFFLLRSFLFLALLLTDNTIPTSISSFTPHLLLPLSFLYTIGFIMLINQRLTTQLREVKDHYELMFNTIPDIVLISKVEDGETLIVNDRFTDLTGYAREEVIGKTSMVLWKNPDDRMRLIDEVREKGRVDSFEADLIKKDGEQISGNTSADPITIDGVPCIISITRDLTEKKRSEAALRESENRYHRVVDSAEEAILVMQDDVMKLVNPSAVDLLKATEHDLVSKMFMTFVHPDDRCSLGDYFKRLRGDNAPKSHPFRLVSNDGVSIWVEIRAILINWEGRPATLIFMMDISERKIAEFALKEANKKLNLLSGITRHDINNQLLVIGGYLTLLERKFGNKETEEGVKKMQMAIERVSAMIQFTKEYEDIGVNAPVWQDARGAIWAASRAVPLDGVKVVNDVPGGTEILADPLIIKVFYNLMHNAVRHGGTITTIRFSLEDVNGGHSIICEDDGMGVSADMKEKLFNRGIGRDHGLGLFLSREILSITGVEIHEVGEPGNGARFVMTVPNEAIRTAQN
ncbi:MAG: PAS domain-containing sensor histidine kinase [Euryarchaeota archaeon]|nr:PAS domain-containing sensor histidine kinase [Euryarchaeota archaeon]